MDTHRTPGQELPTLRWSEILIRTIGSQENLEGTVTDTGGSTYPPSAGRGEINVDEVFMGMTEA